jgi:hypothetical protein
MELIIVLSDALPEQFYNRRVATGAVEADEFNPVFEPGHGNRRHVLAAFGAFDLEYFFAHTDLFIDKNPAYVKQHGVLAVRLNSAVESGTPKYIRLANSALDNQLQKMRVLQEQSQPAEYLERRPGPEMAVKLFVCLLDALLQFPGGHKLGNINRICPTVVGAVFPGQEPVFLL